MAHQAGFENTGSGLGNRAHPTPSATTLNAIRNLVLAFDMDEAGDSATKRGINLAQVEGFNIKIIGSYGDRDESPTRLTLF